MPVIKSAIKKLRRDRRKEKENDQFRTELDRALKLAKKQKTAASAQKAVSLVDRAVKKNLMHKNRAARIKSSLSKLARPVQRQKTKSIKTARAVKSTPKKASKTLAKKTKTTRK